VGQDAEPRGQPHAGLFAAPLAGGFIASPAARLVIAEWIDPGGGTNPPRFIAPLHIHHDDDEAWYVLEGALGVRLDDEDIEVQTGGAVLVPRGTPHTYWNALPTPTRYLLIMTPRIHGLIEALHDGEREPESDHAIFSAHHSTLIGWPER
jgi:mannose-6-phosphate isomerase-like protein (cupin superfamily)